MSKRQRQRRFSIYYRHEHDTEWDGPCLPEWGISSDQYGRYEYLVPKGDPSGERKYTMKQAQAWCAKYQGSLGDEYKFVIASTYPTNASKRGYVKP